MSDDIKIGIAIGLIMALFLDFIFSLFDVGEFDDHNDGNE